MLQGFPPVRATDYAINSTAADIGTRATARGWAAASRTAGGTAATARSWARTAALSRWRTAATARSWARTAALSRWRTAATARSWARTAALSRWRTAATARSWARTASRWRTAATARSWARTAALSRWRTAARNTRPGPHKAGGAVREGSALLQGLASCGHCGRRLRTHYRGLHFDARISLFRRASRRGARQLLPQHRWRADRRRCGTRLHCSAMMMSGSKTGSIRRPPICPKKLCARTLIYLAFVSMACDTSDGSRREHIDGKRNISKMVGRTRVSFRPS